MKGFSLFERIKSMTKTLKLDWSGKMRRTSVRISDEAKKDFVKFYFITSNNITVIWYYIGEFWGMEEVPCRQRRGNSSWYLNCNLTYRSSEIAMMKTYEKSERIKNKFVVVLKYQRMIDIIYITVRKTICKRWSGCILHNREK